MIGFYIIMVLLIIIIIILQNCTYVTIVSYSSLNIIIQTLDNRFMINMYFNVLIFHPLI